MTSGLLKLVHNLSWYFWANADASYEDFRYFGVISKLCSLQIIEAEIVEGFALEALDQLHGILLS